MTRIHKSALRKESYYFWVAVSLLAIASLANVSAIAPSRINSQFNRILRSKLRTLSTSTNFKFGNLGGSTNDAFRTFVSSTLRQSFDASHLESLQNFTSSGAVSKSVGPKCKEHLNLMLTEALKLFGGEMWAVQMVDAWGKFPEGILSGHLASYGDSDQCYHARRQGSTPEDSFQGQACPSYLIPSFFWEEESGNSMIQPRRKVADSWEELLEAMATPIAAFVIPASSYCTPTTCSLEEVQAWLESFYMTNFPLVYPLVIGCESDKLPEKDAGFWAMTSVLGVLATFIVIGSVWDTVSNFSEKYRSLRQQTGSQLLIAFSLPNNIKKWQSTGASDRGFACIHGMRFFSTCWVLISHTYYLLTQQPPGWNTLDQNYIFEESWPIYFLLNGYFSVDTFFTMSGLLASFTISKAFDSCNGNLQVVFSTLKMYLHRYLRLTPAYALIIGLIANYFVYLSSAPIFQVSSVFMADMCKKYWWHNLLYINNIYDYGEDAMCEGESWYLANDMQFFIISPIFIYFLWNKRLRIFGYGLIAAALAGSMFLGGYVTGSNDLPPTAIFWKLDEELKTLDVYQHPWYRISPYLVGILMGSILHSLGKRRVKLHPLVVVLGWTLSTAMALLCLLIIIPYYDPRNEVSSVGAGFYAAISKPLWGAVICWIVFACTKGYGGWINSFLSWKAWVPLGRLTFCVYLSSLSVQMRLQLSYKQPFVYDQYTMINLFFSHLVMCFLVGFILSMTLESPFIGIEKILFRGGSSSADKKGKIVTLAGQVDRNGTIQSPHDDSQIYKVVVK